MKNVNTIGRLGATLVLIGAAVMSSGCSGADEGPLSVEEGTPVDVGAQEGLGESHDPVIYGTDDRREAIDPSVDPVWADIAKNSVATLTDSASLTWNGSSYTFTDSGFTHTLQSTHNLCSTEKFKNQVDYGKCTGTLIDDDLLLIEAQCLNSSYSCPGTAKFVFNYYNHTAVDNSFTINAADIYTCQSIVVQDTVKDYAIVRLDRSAAPTYKPVAVSRVATFLPLNTAVATMGFPSGLPTKVTTGKVTNVSVGSSQFRTDLDNFDLSWGGGVFSNTDHKMRGMVLASFNSDWTTLGVSGTCNVARVCPAGGCTNPENALYTNSILPTLCAAAPSSKICKNIGPMNLWTSQYNDTNGWNGDPSYWQTIKYADLDGDGKTDVCGRGSGGLWCQLSQDVMFQPATNPETIWNSNLSDTNGWKSDPAYWKTIQYADLDGDGKADVCARGGAGMNCALSNGTSFNTMSVWASTFSDTNWKASNSNYGTIQLVDLNNDGRSEVCGRASDGIYCSTPVTSPTAVTTFGAVTKWSSGTDFSNTMSWNLSESYWGTIKFVDVNADGKKDVCGRATDGIRCALANSTGTGFGASSIWSANFSDANLWNSDPSYWGTIQFVDVNNDGMVDACGRGGAGVYCATSNGTSFNTPTVWASQFSDANGWKTDATRWRTIQFGDVSGDGLLDVCARDTTGFSCATNSGSSSFTGYTVWAPAYSNADGWNSNEYYWGTVKLVRRLDGNLKTDVCGRGPKGLICGLSQ